MAQGGKRRFGLTYRIRGHGLCLPGAEESRIGRFPAFAVPPRALPGFLRGPFDIEQVVRDLERQAEFFSEIGEPSERVFPCSREPSSDDHGCPDESSGFQRMGSAKSIRIRPLSGALHVQDLTADHTGRPRRPGQVAGTCEKRGALCNGNGDEDLEGPGQEGIAGKHGYCISECLVTTRFPTTKIVIVHTGQVIVNEGICMNHFNCSGRVIDLRGRVSKDRCPQYAKQAAEAFSAPENAVTHGFEETIGCFGIGEILVERLLDAIPMGIEKRELHHGMTTIAQNRSRLNLLWKHLTGSVLGFRILRKIELASARQRSERRGRVNITEAFKFPFDKKDKGRVWKILLGGLLWWIPILNFFSIGYALSVLKDAQEGKPASLPDWTDWGELFKKGFIAFLISLGYGLALAVVAVLVKILVVYGGYFGQILSVLRILVGLGWLCLIPSVVVALCRYVHRYNPADAFDLKAIFGELRKKLMDYLIASIVLLGVYTVIDMGLGLSSLCSRTTSFSAARFQLVHLFIPFVMFLLMLASFRIFGQIYGAGEDAKPKGTRKKND